MDPNPWTDVRAAIDAVRTKGREAARVVAGKEFANELHKGGNARVIAAELGVHHSTVYRLAKRYGGWAPRTARKATP